MNVVIINDFAYVDGGASQIGLGSSKGLAERGHSVVLFSGVGPAGDSLLQLDRLRLVCLGQHEVAKDPNRLRAMTQGLWNSHAAGELDLCLKGLSPADTVVHVHTWTKALTSSVIRRALDLGFQVVLTLHEYFSVCPTGSFFIHPTQQICHLRPMSAACIATNCDSRNYANKLWRVGRQWMQSHPGRLPSHVRHYISISEMSERIIAPLLPDAARIYRVHNFIDIEQEPAIDAGGNVLFTYAGRLSPEKGPQMLAACATSHRFPLQIIGDGPLREVLAAQLPEAIFTGWLQKQHLRKALQRSRALILPSLWYETQGLVVSEAAALGVPAIVPSTSAACEWVKDGVTGMIFKGGDAADLGEKIAYLQDNPGKARAMGLEAYQQYWFKPTTLSHHCEQLEVVYGKMLATSNHP